MPNQDLTDFFFVLDRSGSMSGRKAQELRAGVNGFLEEQAAEVGEARVTVVIFDGRAPFEIIADRASLDFRLTERNYQPRGSTPLYQACIQGVDHLGAALASEPENQRPGKVVFIIGTDGYENASGHGYTKERLAEMIRHQEATYGWNFIFLGQDIDASAEGAKAGFKGGTTAKTGSFERALKATSSKVRSYRATGNAERLIYTDEERSAIS